MLACLQQVSSLLLKTVSGERWSTFSETEIAVWAEQCSFSCRQLPFSCDHDCSHIPITIEWISAAAARVTLTPTSSDTTRLRVYSRLGCFTKTFFRCAAAVFALIRIFFFLKVQTSLKPQNKKSFAMTWLPLSLCKTSNQNVNTLVMCPHDNI